MAEFFEYGVAGTLDGTEIIVVLAGGITKRITTADLADFVGGELGLQDGDMGDVTISGDGTVITIDDGVVDTDKLANNAVTAAKIAADAVGSSEIANSAVGTNELADNAVTADKIAANAVGSSEIANNAVGVTELADMAVGTILGRPLAVGTGDPVHLNSEQMTAILEALKVVFAEDFRRFIVVTPEEYEDLVLADDLDPDAIYLEMPEEAP